MEIDINAKPADDVSGLTPVQQFRNSQQYLQREAPRVVEQRTQAGLEGLVGDLACVIINVEPERQLDAVADMQHYTGLSFRGAWKGPNYITAALSLAASCLAADGTSASSSFSSSDGTSASSGGARPADILIRSRNRPGENPFRELNDRPKSRHLPNTRLETLVFECFDIERYFGIQKARGVKFITDDIVRTDTYRFLQTRPSALVGASYGFIQWQDRLGTYSFAGGEPMAWDVPAPDRAYRRNIGRLDHVATRLHARDGDAAILELMRLTNHAYSFSTYVQGLNSITNVCRRGRGDVGLVFTTGIAAPAGQADAGPTEQFVHNYGPRMHHLAFETRDIERTFADIKADGMTFMIELVGGPSEGLHQTFTNPSPRTLLVTEYIHRYAGFDGYFTLSNVTALTRATAGQ